MNIILEKNNSVTIPFSNNVKSKKCITLFASNWKRSNIQITDHITGEIVSSRQTVENIKIRPNEDLFEDDIDIYYIGLDSDNKTVFLTFDYEGISVSINNNKFQFSSWDDFYKWAKKIQIRFATIEGEIICPVQNENKDLNLRTLTGLATIWFGV